MAAPLPAPSRRSGFVPPQLWCVLIGSLAAGSSLAFQPPGRPPATESIAIDSVAVPLNSQDPSATVLGDFRYAGGLWLTSRQTDRFRELSDIVVTGRDRLIAVGDAGILVTARLVLDSAGRLIGIADATLTDLRDEDGQPLTDLSRADAEGMTLLANGDRLVSFEQAHRILLYPAAGGPARLVPSPAVSFEKNGGMEALTADPDVGPDAYVVGSEASGDTWTCRVTAPCVTGATVEKPAEFGLVAMRWLPEGRMAYLLRAYDPVRRNRIALTILRGATPVARMEMAPPLTVDNFEGMSAVIDAAGGIRFYLLSDDNASRSQRTLLLAFDWRPR